MSLPENFRNYLRNQNLSPLTVKNYVADVNHFLNWLLLKTNINYRIVGQRIFQLFIRETIEEYKSELLEEKAPLKTVNRRLASLRKFGQYAQSQGWLYQNPAQKVQNPRLGQGKSLAQAFRKYLQKEKVSPVTIKNYVSDINHFLGWLENYQI